MEMCPYDDEFMPWIVIIGLGMFGIGLDGLEALKIWFLAISGIMHRYETLCIDTYWTELFFKEKSCFVSMRNGYASIRNGLWADAKCYASMHTVRKIKNTLKTVSIITFDP